MYIELITREREAHVAGLIEFLQKEAGGTRPVASAPGSHEAAARPDASETALRLEKLFGTSAQSWLNAQLRWDLWHAMRATKVQRVISKIEPLAA